MVTWFSSHQSGTWQGEELQKSHPWRRRAVSAGLFCSFAAAPAGAANLIGSVLYPLTPVDGYVNQPLFAADGVFIGVTGGFAVEWSVPEPAGLSMLLIPAAGTFMRRPRR